MLVRLPCLFPAAFALILSRLHRKLGSARFCSASGLVDPRARRQYVLGRLHVGAARLQPGHHTPGRPAASIVGVLRLSALLALTATGAAFFVVDQGRARWIVAGSIAGVLTVTTLWGQARLQSSDLLTHGEPVRAAVVQGNVAQDEKWNPANREAITGRYITMTRQALAQGASFIMWPESATPLPFEQDILGGSAIRRIAIESQATLLIGSDQVEPIKAATPADKEQSRFYNAAFLVRPDGRSGRVPEDPPRPFGEYVPAIVVFFAEPIIARWRLFFVTRGESPVLCRSPSLVIRPSVRVIFPTIVNSSATE